MNVLFSCTADDAIVEFGARRSDGSCWGRRWKSAAHTELRKARLLKFDGHFTPFVNIRRQRNVTPVSNVSRDLVILRTTNRTPISTLGVRNQEMGLVRAHF
jgi:hypothetical protein